MEAELAAGLDLAQAGGQQGGVAAVHLGAQVLEDADRPFHVGADEVLGRAGPRGQLDLLAVEQGEMDRRVEGGGGDEERQGGGLARSGLAPEQQVALGQADAHRVAVLVDAEGDGLPQDPGRDRPRRSGHREGVAPDDGEVGDEALSGSRSTRTSRAPMVAARVGAGRFDLLAREPGRHAQPDPLARPGWSRSLRPSGSGRGG